ncbi:MAG: mucoidy inhibitor MuiA family protein [Candidatus Coatesbacteria bacterium]|nr:MAG: mucoidy inhibitor MuiA family protein [Candidatus Coatesbacteria bacterium]
MERIELDSKVSAVTVYADRAMVTRTAKAELDVGDAEVVVSGLPAALDEYSFRVGGSGIAIIKVMSVELAREYRGAPPDKERTRVWKAIQKTEDEKRVLETEQAFLADKITFLRKTAKAGHDDLSKTLARKRINVDEGKKIIDFFFSGIDKLNKQVEKNHLKLRELDEKLDKLRREWEKLESPRLMEGKSAVVRAEVSRGGAFDMELTYVVYGAGWESGYDIRMDTEANKLQLDYRAGVVQQTGEDWEGVTLRLSTANPGLGANPPELSPAYVDFFYPVVSAGVPAAVPKAEKEAEGVEELDEFAGEVQAVAGDVVPEPAAAEVAKSEVTGEGPSVTYVVPGSPSIPSDGNPHIVAISEEEFDGAIDYVLVPEYAESAYIRAKATNESELVLLPGATNVYRDDDFVGRGVLELVNPGAEFECYLGADERI